MTTRNQEQESELVGEFVGIFRRGQRWWANYQLGGRQHRQTLKTTSKKEARQRALRLEAELVSGRHPSPKPAGYEEAIDEYLQYLVTERRASKTLTKYTFVLERLTELLRGRRAGSLLDLDIRSNRLSIATGVRGVSGLTGRPFLREWPMTAWLGKRIRHQ
jgi:hypothetical protein